MGCPILRTYFHSHTLKHYLAIAHVQKTSQALHLHSLGIPVHTLEVRTRNWNNSFWSDQNQSDYFFQKNKDINVTRDNLHFTNTEALPTHKKSELWIRNASINTFILDLIKRMSCQQTNTKSSKICIIKKFKCRCLSRKQNSKYIFLQIFKICIINCKWEGNNNI